MRNYPFDSTSEREMLRKFRKSNERLVILKIAECTITQSASLGADVPKRHSSATLVRSTGSDAGGTHQRLQSNVTACFRGEGVRTVVLARTKKGYGFVLRGAKGRSDSEICA